MSTPLMTKDEAITGMRGILQQYREFADSVGMDESNAKLDAALLLEDEQQIERYMTRWLLELRGVLAAQVAQIDGLLAEVKK